MLTDALFISTTEYLLSYQLIEQILSATYISW